MLDKGSPEQQHHQRVPPAASSSKPSVQPLSSRSSTSHPRSSTRQMCSTVLSNPLHPQALSPVSEALSPARSPTAIQHSKQQKLTAACCWWWCWCWPPIVHCHSIVQEIRWLLLLLLCLQNLGLTGSRSIQLQQSSLTDPWKEAELYQAVQLPPDSYSDEPVGRSAELHERVRSKRSELYPDNPYLWPNATIPYKFSPSLELRHTRQLQKAFNYFQTRLCVRFVPYTGGDEHFVTFQLSSLSCSSLVGLYRFHRSQSVTFTNNCYRKLGVILHEISHLLGMYHEHQRWDRDKYINIVWENVNPRKIAQFYKYNFDTYGVEYDLASIMQYSLNFFSRDGIVNSMEVRDNVTHSVAVIGRQLRPSKGDLTRLNRMYNCPSDLPTTSHALPTSTSHALPTSPEPTQPSSIIPTVSNNLNPNSFPAIVIPTTPPTTPTTPPTTPTNPPTTPTPPITPTTPPTTPTKPPTTPTNPPTTLTTLRAIPPTTPTAPPTMPIAPPTTPSTPPTTPTAAPTTPTTPPTTPTIPPTTPTAPPTMPITPPTTPSTPPTTPTAAPTTPTAAPTTPTAAPTTPTVLSTTPTAAPTMPITPPTTPATLRATPPTTPTVPPTTPSTPPTTPSTPPTTPSAPPTTPTAAPTMPTAAPTTPSAPPTTPTAAPTTPTAPRTTPTAPPTTPTTPSTIPTTATVVPDTDESTTVTSAIKTKVKSGDRVALMYTLDKQSVKVTHPQWLRCSQQRCSLDNCLANAPPDHATNCSYNFFTLHKVNSNADKRIRVGDEIVLEFLPPEGHRPSSERSMYVTCNTTLRTCGISSTCNQQERGHFSPYCVGNVMIVRSNTKKLGKPVNSMDVVGFEFKLLAEETFFFDQCALGCDGKTSQCFKQSCIFIPNFLGGYVEDDRPARCGKDMFQIQKIGPM